MTRPGCLRICHLDRSKCAAQGKRLWLRFRVSTEWAGHLHGLRLPWCVPPSNQINCHAPGTSGYRRCMPFRHPLELHLYPARHVLAMWRGSCHWTPALSLAQSWTSPNDLPVSIRCHRHAMARLANVRASFAKARSGALRVFASLRRRRNCPGGTFGSIPQLREARCNDCTALFF